MAPQSASNALGNLGVLLWSHLAGLAAWLVLRIEYAFDLSVTRPPAMVRARDGAVSETVHGLVSDAMSAHMLMLVQACGLSPLWLYLGMERVRGAVMLDSVAQNVVTGCTTLMNRALYDLAGGCGGVGLSYERTR